MNKQKIKCLRCGKEFKLDFIDCIALCKKCRLRGTRERYIKRSELFEN